MNAAPANKTGNPSAPALSRQRCWSIVGLIFVVALINYFDRQSLSVVAPRLQAQLHLSDEGYGHIVSLFLLASAFSYAGAGLIADWLGTRASMALFVGWWSLAEASTAFVTSAFQLAVARFCLGLGEPGLWVAAPKGVGEIFARKERGLAIGIYTLGAMIGAVIALPVIVAVTTHFHWRAIFLLDGAAGILWIPLWFLVFRRSSTADVPSESRLTDEHGSLRDVLSQGSTWRLMIARGLTDPVWYFYLFWFPKYLLSARHMTMAAVAHQGWLVYLFAGAGTLLGGMVSGTFIRRRVPASIAYRRTMLIFAMIVPLSPLAGLVAKSWVAIAIASVIALAHMAWLVTLTATIVELYPVAEVGRAAGLIAAGSALGGMLSTEVIAALVTSHGYLPVFTLMAFLHPLALLLIWNSFHQRRSVVAVPA